jgi:hypothetical protein
LTPILLSTVGSAIGGFIGVILFFLIRYLIEIIRSRPVVIRVYLCGNLLNKGDKTEVDGEIKHHHGKLILEKSEYRELDVNNPIWEWTRDSAGVGTGSTVIYGPYSTDFPEPGSYSAEFRIRGIGFSKPSEIKNNLILLELDVNRTLPQYTTSEKNLMIIPSQYKIARRFVCVSELAKGGWQDFKVPFHSDCQGLWEYRIFAYDGLYDKPDNIGRFGKDVRILFDSITIKKENKLSLPWI